MFTRMEPQMIASRDYSEHHRITRERSARYRHWLCVAIVAAAAAACFPWGSV